MKCPYCNDGVAKVLETRERNGVIWRRRVCQNEKCKHRMTTSESERMVTVFEHIAQRLRFIGFTKMKIDEILGIDITPIAAHRYGVKNVKDNTPSPEIENVWASRQTQHDPANH